MDLIIISSTVNLYCIYQISKCIDTVYEKTVNQNAAHAKPVVSAGRAHLYLALQGFSHSLTPEFGAASSFG